MVPASAQIREEGWESGWLIIIALGAVREPKFCFQAKSIRQTVTKTVHELKRVNLKWSDIDWYSCIRALILSFSCSRYIILVIVLGGFVFFFSTRYGHCEDARRWPNRLSLVRLLMLPSFGDLCISAGICCSRHSTSSLRKKLDLFPTSVWLNLVVLQNSWWLVR